MTTVAVAAGKKAVKKVVQNKAKSVAVSSGKHSAKPKRELTRREARAKERTAQRVATTKTAITDAGTKVKRQHSSLVKKATATYSVRRYHNILVAMWLTGTAILIASFFQNDNLVPLQKWKKLFAFQFAMFILSLLVLIQSLSKVVAYLSVAIVLAIAFTSKDDLLNTMNSFSNGLTPPPIGTGVAKGVQKQVPIGYVTNTNPPIVPRNTDNSSNNTIYT